MISKNIAKLLIIRLLHKKATAEQQIWVFDRGFPSLVLLQKLMEHNLKFVIRVPKCFLREVNEFRKSKYVDKIVHVDYTKERMKNSHVKSNGICEFDLRCVRIQLKNEEEILITNLAREAFPKRDIRELYRLRWDIETGFNYFLNPQNSIKKELKKIVIPHAKSKKFLNIKFSLNNA